MASHSQPHGLYDLLKDLFNFRPGDVLFLLHVVLQGLWMVTGMAMEDEATVCCLVNEQLAAILG